MTANSVKKSKMKATGLIALIVACGIMALRVNYRGAKVMQQPDDPSRPLASSGKVPHSISSPASLSS